MAKKPIRFLLLDVSALVYRAYFALPDLTSLDGRPAGALYGFLSIVMRVLRDRKPTHVAAAMDLPGKTFRHETYKEYKATRPPMPDDLRVQFGQTKAVIEALGVPILASPGFEADDAIATAVWHIRKEHPDAHIEIVSSDADILQLVDEKTSVIAPRRGVTDMALLDPAGVEQKLGVPPDRVTDYKALRGDSSDNIPGVRGIGEKTAVALLHYAGSLEQLLASARKIPKDAPKELIRFSPVLAENAATIRASKKLVTLRSDVPIPIDITAAEFTDLTTPAFVSTVKRLGFESLLRRAAGSRRNASQKDPVTAGPSEGQEQLFAAEESIEDFLAAQEKQTLKEIQGAEEAGAFSKEVADLERAIVPIISDMERRGIAVDRQELARLREQFGTKRDNLEREIFTLAGEKFNLSSPKQMGDILFGKLQIQSRKKTAGGQRSTAAAVLEELRDDHPIIESILHWREVAKLLSTYIETLPALINPQDERIHARFWQLGAATGRIASSDPNLQNIPVRGEDGKLVRNVFRAGEGRLLLAADYEQIELRVAAVLAQDEVMIETFQEGKDFHEETARRIFHVAKGKVLPEMRRRAKVLNFGILYGMGPRRVSKEMNVSFDEARAFLETYFGTYRKLAAWIEKVKRDAARDGYTTTAFGRKRFFPEIRSKNAMLRAQAERAAMNAPIQGTATGDLVKRGMVALAQRVPEATMLVQVHDEILAEVEKGREIEIAARVQEALEGVWPESPVAFPVRVSVGERWGNLQKV